MGKYPHFGGTCCLHLQGTFTQKTVATIFSETVPFSKLYGFTFLKTLSLGNLYAIFAGKLEENGAFTTAKSRREGNLQGILTERESDIPFYCKREHKPL
jgi:hypothetical protein